MAVFLFFPYSNQLGSTIPSITLARVLQQHGHRVVYASNGKFTSVLLDKGFEVVPINEISYHQYRRHVDNNNVDFYSESLIHHMVDMELDLIGKINPDCIVTNNRPTVKLSSQIAKKKMITIVIPTLTRYYNHDYYIPENHFLNTYYPFGDSNNLISPSLRKTAFLKTMQHWAKHFVPVCKHFQIPDMKDYLSVYEGDITLINQSPGLMPFHPLPSNYFFLEQNLDSTFGGEKHPWLSNLKKLQAEGKKIIYVSMGSSALKSYPVVMRLLRDSVEKNSEWVLVSNHTGLEQIHQPHARVFSEKFLHANEILPLASVVVTHGGVNTLSECLLEGKPIVGVPEQGEQLWNLKYMEDMGLGKVVSKFKLEKQPQLLLQAIKDVLESNELPNAQLQFKTMVEQRKSRYNNEQDLYQAILQLLK
jgi:UDP:flavonoid glycosyltransferase YjiC (YdhE family)